EHIAAAAEIPEHGSRDLADAEDVGNTHRPERIAVVAGINEGRGTDRQPGRRIDEQVALGVALVEGTRHRARGHTGRHAVADVAVEPGVRDVRLRQGVRQRNHAPLRLVVVGDDFPRQILLADREAAEHHLGPAVPGLCAVQVEEDEAG
ncbi:MAG: hypothetical protein ACK55I_29905, partial [bacterium]